MRAATEGVIRHQRQPCEAAAGAALRDAKVAFVCMDFEVTAKRLSVNSKLPRCSGIRAGRSGGGWPFRNDAGWPVLIGPGPKRSDREFQ
jgi:hypothetical protein